jgi:hypothetical protein
MIKTTLMLTIGYDNVYDCVFVLSVGVLYGKYCGVWCYIPIQINIVGLQKIRNTKTKRID